MKRAAAWSMLRHSWVIAMSLSCIGCDERFEYDIPRGGAVTGGSNAGGQAATGGVAVSGGGAGGASGTGVGGAPCGAGPACPAGLHCVDSACRQCGSDADCAASDVPRCDPASHRCVQCLVAADCPRDFNCDPVARHCLRACGADLPCPEDAHGCDEQRMICYACDEDYECEDSPFGSFCAIDGIGCVQCRGNLGCEPPQLCDELTGRCVECRDGSDCASKLCDPQSYRCLPG